VERARTKKMMKGKTIVDTEKLQELLKLVRAFEDQLSAAEIATENGELMASDLSERMAETKEDYMKKHEYNRNRISSNIVADYARDALFSVREMGGAILQYHKSIGVSGN
jgi:hypothetical protein